MEVRPGYKQTEVGVIPEDWEVEPLGMRASFKTGPFGSALHQSDYIEDGIPVVNPMHINDCQITPSAKMSVAEDAACRLTDFRMKPGEIIIGRRGDMGRCAVVDEQHAGWICGTGSMLIRPRLDHPYFIQRILSSSVAIKSIEDTSVGSTIINLNQATLSRLNIQIPPIDEQRAIATALSDMDALLDGLDRLITKKRAIKQATMQQLLTGQTRLPGFSGEWEVKQLGDIAWIEMGQSPDSRHYNRSGNGLPLIQGNADIEDRRTIARVWTTQVTKGGIAGDLLMTVRAPVGAVGKISENCCLGRGVCSIRPKVETDFLFHTLVHLESAWKNLEQGSTFTSANSKQVASFTLLVPVDSQEQISIATILTDMDTEITALETRRTKTRALKQAMMQELLTGRTRLV